MTYILLFALIGLVIIGVVRATRQGDPKKRQHREPFLGNNDPIEAVAVEPQVTTKPRNSQREPTRHPHNAEYSIDQRHEIAPPPPEPLDSHLDHPRPHAENTTTIEPAPPLQLTDLIIINLTADPKQPYRGYELLQALLTAGLRYSRKGMFHRYEDLTGRGSILFNLVSSIEPGTFDLPKMGSFTTAGLTLFMQIPVVKDPRQAFELMLSTAKELIEDLGGELLDDHRQPLNEEKIAKWRSYVQ